MTKLSKSQASNLLILLNLFSGYTQNEDIPAFEFVDMSIPTDAVAIKICIALDEDELADYGFEFEVEDEFYLITL